MKMALMLTMQIFIFAFGSDTGHYKDELESVKHLEVVVGRHRDLDTTLFCQELFLQSNQQLFLKVYVENLDLYDMQVITDHVMPEKGANVQFLDNQTKPTV